jgi:hypothetical protein
MSKAHQSKTIKWADLPSPPGPLLLAIFLFLKLRDSSAKAVRLSVVSSIAFGIGMIQVDEYLAAIVCWLAAGTLLIIRAVHWQGIADHPIQSAAIRSGWVVAAVVFFIFLFQWTEIKRGDKPWSIVIVNKKAVTTMQSKATTEAEKAPKPPISEEEPKDKDVTKLTERLEKKVIRKGGALPALQQKSFKPMPENRPTLAELVVEGLKDQMTVVFQTGQPFPPKVTKFAKIRVTNTGNKSAGDVKIVVVKVNNFDSRLQLPVSSTSTLFIYPNPRVVLGSATLNPGDDQEFDALVECNGAICTKGELAVPHVESGKIAFASRVSGGLTVDIREITVRVSSDSTMAVTKTLLVSLGPEGQLFLETKPE